LNNKGAKTQSRNLTGMDFNRGWMRLIKTLTSARWANVAGAPRVGKEPEEAHACFSTPMDRLISEPAGLNGHGWEPRAGWGGAMLRPGWFFTRNFWRAQGQNCEPKTPAAWLHATAAAGVNLNEIVFDIRLDAA